MSLLFSCRDKLYYSLLSSIECVEEKRPTDKRGKSKEMISLSIRIETDRFAIGSGAPRALRAETMTDGNLVIKTDEPDPSANENVCHRQRQCPRN